MDAVNDWKKILLQWIKECNFLEKSFYSIDQTEIELFFIHFKDRFKDVCLTNLPSFLKEQYPLFEPHFDDENILSSSDHFYVYSLLLHFSCVRCPNAFFQENCQKLNEFAQQNIKTFFQKLLDEQSLTKETLRRVIASLHVFTPPSNRFTYTADSPMKTPRKTTDVSPPTPRSCMLQEKNKKVYALKAQLETVSYEKSTMETDLKNYQDKIAKLKHELKRSQQEIQDLKREISLTNIGSGDCEIRHTEEEQINRRLSKQIAQKEIEIAKQRDNIESLTEQKDVLSEKLKNAEKQIKVLQSSIGDLAEKVDDLSQELEHKEHTIQNLSDANTELEQWISELRSSTVNSRPDFNMSSEFLDMSRATNSSGSIHSPENLGSVVDIKLREKENENEKLREEISAIRFDNSKLSKAMSELTITYSKLFDICNENLIIDQDSADPANCFIIFSNYMQSFASKYEENAFALNRSKENAKRMADQSQDLASKLDEIQNENTSLKKEIDELLGANKSLIMSRTSLENAITELEIKLENCLKERSEEANNLKNLQKELESVKAEKLYAETTYKTELDDLKATLKINQDELAELTLTNENNNQLLKENKYQFSLFISEIEELNNQKIEQKSEIELLSGKWNESQKVINENEQRFKEFEEDKQNLEKKVLNFEEIEKSLSEKLDLEKSQSTELEKQNNNLLVQLEKSQQDYNSVLIQKNFLLNEAENTKQQIYSMQKKVQTLTDAQSHKNLTISNLKADKEMLVNSLQTKIDIFTNAIDEHEKLFEQKSHELSELQKRLLSTETELNSRQRELEEVSIELRDTKEVSCKQTENILSVATDLKTRLAFLLSKNSLKPSEESSELDDDEQFNSKLSNEIRHLHDDITHFGNAYDLLMEETISLRQKLLELENKADNLDQKNCVLGQELESERAEQLSITEKFQDQITNMNSSIKKLETDIETVQLLLSNKTQDNVMILEKYNQAEALIAELQTKTLRLESDSKLANQTVEERNRELENVKLQLETEISQKLEIKENLDSTTGCLRELQSKIDLLETEAQKLKENASKSADELNREFESTKHQLEIEVTEKQQIRENLEHARLQLESETTEKQKIKEDLDSIKLQLESEVSEKKQSNKDLELVKKQLETEVTEKGQIKEEKLKLSENLEHVRLQLENETTEKQKIKEDLESIKLQLESEVTEKKQTNDQLELVKIQLESEVAEKQKIKEDCESIKLQLENEVEAKHQAIKDFEIKKQQLETEISEKLHQYDSEVTKTRHLLEDLENTKLQLESEISNKQKIEDELKRTKLLWENQVTETNRIKEDLEQVRLQLESDVMEKWQIKEDFESIKLQLENEIKEKNEIEQNLKETKLQLESKNSQTVQILEELESTKLHLESEATEKSKAMEDLQIANKELNELQWKIIDLETDFKKVNETAQIYVEEKRKLIENSQLQLEKETSEKNQLKNEVTKALNELKELHNKILNLEAENEAANQKAGEYSKQLENVTLQLEKQASEKNQLTDDLSKALSELKELQNKILDLEAGNEVANKQAEEYKKQLENAMLQLDNETTEKEQVRKAFENANNEKVSLENKYQDMATKAETYKNDLQLKESDLSRLKNEKTHLLAEIELLKNSSETQILKCNKEIDEQKENISRLIQELASIRKEKGIAQEENKHLVERLEVQLNEKKSIETNRKTIEEKLQSVEKEVLVKVSLLKTEQFKCQDLENQLKKLQMENAKVKDTADSYMKRIEKQALTLGESQAKCQKLRKEADIAQNSLEMLKSSTDGTQRENSRLNQECKSLKEKLSKCEKSNDQLESKLQTLDREVEKLREENKTLETSENDLKTSKASLEKIKLNLEDKIRKLAKSLSDSNVALSRLEQDKVQLNLEVGGLNKQLQENRALLNMKLAEIETLTSNLTDAKNTNSQLVKLNEKHQNEVTQIQEENSRLNDQLSKLSLRLQITQEEHESAKTKLENLRSDVEASEAERDVIEKEHRTALERLVGIEDLVEEQRLTTETEFVDKIKSLEKQIAKMTTDYENLEEIRNKEKLANKQLNEDISIFKAKLQKSRTICEENEKKWNDEKDLLLAEIKQGEERIKDTRLELEGKLEKMKNKMKTLYNDEVTKMKKKQEREVAVFKTDIDALKAKNEKHEVHIKKLSSQIFRLNENILDYQKKNNFLTTKLNDLENNPRQLSRVRKTSGAQSSAHQVLSSNLRMEDEEGEVFNNTYLSDLKDGRMSEYFNTDISAQELQYRNSLVPPHLKSTYLAQFDHQMGEDEIRDTPNLDDSLSTLLNTGQRKKLSGATSYKRPGPPTPSKNAGRLSFGGIGELNREVLKESLDMASCSSTSKTPAKFKLFSSRLSIRDERKSFVTNFKRKQHIIPGTVQCSSTPRKSKAHIDQRRLLDQMMSTASPGTELSPNSIVRPAVNLPSSLKNLELSRRMSSYKWRQPKLSYATDSGNSDVNSPQIKDAKYASSGSKQRLKRVKDRRGSIYLRGGMFARNCRTPTMGYREVFKNKSKIQRNANFNKYRNQMLNECLVKKASFCPECCDEPCNNNNNDDDFFLEEINMNNHMIEDSNLCDEDVNNDQISKHFKQMLEVKESNAPFEISDINAAGPSYSNLNYSSSNVHSRTIYGASVILNRKIPNVSTTMVRKSSIYVKGNDGKSVILVTNQTIGLKDLAEIWFQMNVSAKSFIAFCFTAMLIGMSYFVIHFIDREER